MADEQGLEEEELLGSEELAAHVAAIATGATTNAEAAGEKTMRWRTLPTVGEGLVRILAAGGIGLLTGLGWNIAGRTPPAGFLPALGWALALGLVALGALAVSSLLDGDLRVRLGLSAVRAGVSQALGVLLAFLVLLAALVALLPETATLGLPTTFAVALGLGTGFALGGLRLRALSGDACWLFIGMGTFALFGLTLTFIVPAALAPTEKGALGFFGCLIFVFGLPGVAIGTIGGGALRLRVERATFGTPTLAEEDESSTRSPAVQRRATAMAHAPVLGAVATEAFQPILHEEDDTMNTDTVTEVLTERRQALLEAITGLSDEALDRKEAVGHWSIKNVLAHLTAWEEVVTRITPERVRSGTYPEELQAINTDEDAYNARMISAREHLTPQEQLAQLARARARLLEMVQGLGNE